MKNTRVRLHLGLVSAQAAFAGFEILSRVTLDRGTSKFAFSFYRNCLATLILGSAAIYFERKEWKKLSFIILVNLFFMGLAGVTMNQILYLAGLGYTSPVFASAMRNTTPVFTFLLAWICRKDGVAKVMGCLIGILGSIFLSIYRGPAVFESHFSLPNVASGNEKYIVLRYVHIHFLWINTKVGAKLLGSVYLICSCFVFSVFLIMQAKLLEKFEAPISCAAFMCLFSVIQIPPLAFLFERDKSKWKITKAGAISILYSGLIASGFVSAVQSWAVHKGGPVIVAAYQPLETTVTAVLGFFFLKETLHMGSILGGCIVIVGLYMLIWGQLLEQRRILSRTILPLNDNNQPSNVLAAAGADEPSLATDPMEIICVADNGPQLKS